MKLSHEEFRLMHFALDLLYKDCLNYEDLKETKAGIERLKIKLDKMEKEEGDFSANRPVYRST